MASKKRKKRKKGSGGGSPHKASGSTGAAKPSGAGAAKAPTASGPSVMQFLERLGGAPTAPRRSTPAKGLLGDISRKDLVAAGRIDADSPEGPPADPHPTGPAPTGVEGDGASVDVEVSVPDGAPVGRRAERRAWREVVKVASVVAGPHRAANADNLSASGIFIETARLLDVGDPVVLAFPTEAGAPLNVSGRVRWVTPFGGAVDAKAGMGIEFVGLDGNKRARLASLLDGLPIDETPAR